MIPGSTVQTQKSPFTLMYEATVRLMAAGMGCEVAAQRARQAYEAVMEEYAKLQNS
jgi:hypothetical protein